MSAMRIEVRGPDITRRRRHRWQVYMVAADDRSELSSFISGHWTRWGARAEADFQRKELRQFLAANDCPTGSRRG